MVRKKLEIVEEGCTISRLPQDAVKAGYKCPILMPDTRGWTGYLALFYTPEGRRRENSGPVVTLGDVLAEQPGRTSALRKAGKTV